EEDQPIVELQTDKMITELTAPTKGTVTEILIKEGTTIPVGTTILTIETEGTTPETENAVDKPSQKSSQNSFSRHSKATDQPLTGTKSTKFSRSKRIKAAPHTKKVAREHGVEI